MTWCQIIIVKFIISFTAIYGNKVELPAFLILGTFVSNKISARKKTLKTEREKKFVRKFFWPHLLFGTFFSFWRKKSKGFIFKLIQESSSVRLLHSSVQGSTAARQLILGTALHPDNSWFLLTCAQMLMNATLELTLSP